jgi:hypothetical protein
MPKLGEAPGLEAPGRLGGESEGGGDVPDHSGFPARQAEPQPQHGLLSGVEQADPSGGVSRVLEAFVPVELLHCVDEAEVAFLYEVEQR